MPKCIICGKEVDKTYGNSNLMGVYCRSCATENHYTNEQLIEDLQKQLAITKKALELACERVKYFEEMQDREMGFFEFFGYDNEYDLQSIIEQYKQQANDKLKGSGR